MDPTAFWTVTVIDANTFEIGAASGAVALAGTATWTSPSTADVFAIGDSTAGQQLHLFPSAPFTTNTYLGEPWVNNYVPPATAPISTTDLFQVGLATVLPANAGNSPQTLSLSQGTSLNVGSAAALEGVSAGDQLQNIRDIGDINGDGHDAYYAESGKYGYIFYGPVSLSGITSLADQADLVINISDTTNTANPILGHLAATPGDVNGDGVDDLVFYNLLSGSVTGASNTSGIQITAAAPNGLSTGDQVTITGVQGNTAANGTWTITVINSTTFQLNGATGNGAYTSGGTWASLILTTIYGTTFLPQNLGTVTQFASSSSGVRWSQASLGVNPPLLANGAPQSTAPVTVNLLQWNGDADADVLVGEDGNGTNDARFRVFSGTSFLPGSGPVNPVNLNTVTPLLTINSTSAAVGQYATVVGDVNGLGLDDIAVTSAPLGNAYVFDNKNIDLTPSTLSLSQADLTIPLNLSASHGGPDIGGLVELGDIGAVYRGTITAVSGGDGSPVAITSPSNGLSSGQAVLISNVAGVDPSTLWTVTCIDSNTFEIAATSGAVALNGSAAWARSSSNDGYGDFAAVTQTAISSGIDSAVNLYFGGTAALATNSITGVALSGGYVTVTSTGHGLVNGQQVLISGVTGISSTTTWTIQGVTTNTFQLVGATGSTFTVNTGATWTLLATPGLSIQRSGPTSSGYVVSLTPTEGDFNGDGNPDLAILETDSLNSTLVFGQVYIFYDIAAKAAAAPLVNGVPTISLSSADAVITSNNNSGILTSISVSPSIDLNSDGLSDLLLGASQATGTIGGLHSAAGLIYYVQGARTQSANIPTGNVLSNDSVAGVGSFLVDPGTGQPVQFNSLLPENTSDAWYQFTTQGDGLPGNYISITPSAATVQPVAIQAEAAGNTSDVLTSTSPAITVSSSSPGIYEFDLSSAMSLLQADPNNPSQSLLASTTAQLELSYNSSNQDFPTTINLNQPSQRAVVGNLVYFTANDGTGLSLADRRHRRGDLQSS